MGEHISTGRRAMVLRIIAGLHRVHRDVAKVKGRPIINVPIVYLHPIGVVVQRPIVEVEVQTAGVVGLTHQ